ncbi:MAG: 3-deoxy-manno-octulosonate cytidylyltransferase [Cyclobacteriaceae bacterium]|nr:3-deoxy-manno-octulosonate cytidylyltransferase [Cyclobacteriaceae bacterium]
MVHKIKILGIIPARFQSTRFPGKVLVDIKGKSMVQRVYEQATKSTHLTKVIIATESEEVKKHIEAFGGEAILTSDTHVSGTDRCYEALKLQTEAYDYVINIQGDEPFIAPSQIDELAQLLDARLPDEQGQVELATLIKKISTSAELFNYGEVKTVFNKNMEALYFSRQPIPYCRNQGEMEWLTHQDYYKHIGIYAYRVDVLEKISKLPISALEKAESLEQLRWIENGFKVKLAYTKHESVCIDTKEDLEKVLANIDSFL